MKCPHCNQQINIGKILGSLKSKKKAESSKINGMKGGRPKATTLPNIKNNARAARGETARFTKKNIFSAKLRLRELAGKFTTENTENTEGRK